MQFNISMFRLALSSDIYFFFYFSRHQSWHFGLLAAWNRCFGAQVSSKHRTWYSERVILQFMSVGSLAGVTYLRYTVLTSPKKGEIAVHWPCTRQYLLGKKTFKVSDLISHVAKTKAARLAHAMAEPVNFFFSVFNISSKTSASIDKTKNVYISDTIKRTISVTFSACQHFNSFFQTNVGKSCWQDTSTWPSGGPLLVTNKTKKIEIIIINLVQNINPARPLAALLMNAVQTKNRAQSMAARLTKNKLNPVQNKNLARPIAARLHNAYVILCRTKRLHATYLLVIFG